MARVVWCRHCGFGYPVLAGALPDQCPNGECKKPARWCTEHWTGWRIPLSQMDKRFLRSLHISPEDAEEIP